MDQDGFVCAKGEGVDLIESESRAQTLPPSPEKNDALPENDAASTRESDYDMDDADDADNPESERTI